MRVLGIDPGLSAGQIVAANAAQPVDRDELAIKAGAGCIGESLGTNL